jgi:hypothetical protein
MRAGLFGDARDLVVYGGFAAVFGSGLSDTDREGLGDIWVYRFGSGRWERRWSLPIADDVGGNEGYGSSAVVGSTMIVFGARRMLRRSEPVYSNSYAQFNVDTGDYEFLPSISGPAPLFPSARTGPANAHAQNRCAVRRRLLRPASRCKSRAAPLGIAVSWTGSRRGDVCRAHLASGNPVRRRGHQRRAK